MAKRRVGRSVLSDVEPSFVGRRAEATIWVLTGQPFGFAQDR